ncbi:Sodium/hydrogen exchanger family-domain-containing protein [Mucor mucedo]|uniref:Sodium/hydrogen exchanger family-domain-containing protein n=1 Tax=Mucor mucedo TaxID=29922 RepID=UPI00221EAAA9|nr:Sodium/hydrogen exchanger family-domain-containing protein [Mucor mucedo]KAI7890666.1 Sodium/hydrogen exchanger family-domain-containing protein [Mucor mucedo]
MAIDTVSVIAAVLGGFILLYGLSSLVIKERLYISEASVAIVCGIVFGPLCAKFIDISQWGNEEVITKEFTRIVIAIQVMAAGVALPKRYLYKELRSLLVLLGPVMIWMWLISGLLVWAFIPGLNYLEALMIAACFTPTDPILANSIVQGKFAEKHVPLHVRQIISCESGANDGLGYPFLFLAIYLLQMNTGAAIGKWAYWIMCYNVLLSCIIGFVAGYVARKLLKYSEQKKYIDKESLLVFSVALALFLMGTVGLIGSDDLLACFIAGNSFTWDDWFRIETEKAHLMEVVDILLNLSVFVYIGATMPWSLFNSDLLQISVWRLVVLAILVLIFRRLPIVLALYKLIPAIKTWREAVFTGWFGPIGVGAIFYYSIALESVPLDGPNAHAREVLKPVIYFMVLASVIAHGITIPLFYIGTFATRTLTRTSESGNPVLQLPKFESFGKASPTIIEQVQEKTIVKPVESSLPTEQQRHTTITILTPEEIKQREESPPLPNFDSAEEIPPNQHNTSRRRSHVVVDDDDCTMYLP